MAKYRIELTENQLSILRQAVEMMMRTGIDQTLELSEWIVSNGEQVRMTNENSGTYIILRDIVMDVIGSIMNRATMIPVYNRRKSDKVLELQTLYDAIKHQLWLDADIDHTSYSVDRLEPMKWGAEPIPKIERVEE